MHYPWVVLCILVSVDTQLERRREAMRSKLEKEQQEIDERLDQLEADKAVFEAQQRKYEQESEAMRNTLPTKG